MLTKGGELYRDASLLPLPGAFYLLELAFEIFGPSIRLARWIVVFEFALLCVAAFSLLRRLVPVGVAWTGVAVLLLYRIWVFPHWQMYSYSTTSLVVLAWALLGVVFFFETGRRWVLALAGLATGLGVLCKQDYGAAGWVAMNAVLLIFVLTARRDGPQSHWRLLGWYNLPALTVGAATALHFAHQGLFLEMLRQTFLNHLIGIATFDYPSGPPILPLFAQEPLLRGPVGYTVYAPSILATLDWERLISTSFFQDTFLWDLGIKLCFYLPYAIACVSAVRLGWLRDRLGDPALRLRYLTELALSAYAILLLAALSKPVDWVHLMVLCWPLACLVTIHVHALVAGRGWPVRAALALGLLPGLAAAGYTVDLAWRLRAEFPTRLGLERGGIYVRPSEARVIREAVAYVEAHTEPGEPFTVLPYFPLISFLADRAAPHRAAYVLWPVEDVPDRQREIIQALEASDAKHLIYHFNQWVQYPKMEEFAPELFGHLVERYEIDLAFGGACWAYEVAGLERTEGSRAGRALIGSDGADASLGIALPGRAPRMLAADGWSRFVRRERWPFREVLAVQPLACGPSLTITVPARIPEGSRLRTAVGTHANHWCAEPAPQVTFIIQARVEGQVRPLYSRTLDPLRRPKDRGWFEVDLSLDGLAHQDLELEFVTQCRGEGGDLRPWGGWEEPLILAPTSDGLGDG
jgi:hypothetical protein